MSKNHFLLAFLCSFCFTFNASADYIDGQRAYASGDYEAAILVWTQVAQDGNARAQYNLGWMHANGRGIAQDFQEAIKCIQKLLSRVMLMLNITWAICIFEDKAPHKMTI